MSNKFLLFLLYIFLNCSISLANIKSGCNSIISEKFLHEMENILPHTIEIKVEENRKWLKHNFKMIKDTYGVNGGEGNETGGHVLISSKYKKNFKAIVDVYFKNKIKCSFQAKIRQHGDFIDHIEIINGNLFQSLDINLINGNINGITKFKLFIPKTRNNPEDEIFLTEVLRNLDYLAPRTGFVSVKMNNLKKLMLFQEKAEKEMLEYNLRREGPILEGDERFIWSPKYKNSYGIITTQPSLARQSNPKWALKSKQHENISHEALTRFNLFYLKSRSSENLNGTLKEYNLNILDSGLLSPNNPNQIQKIDMYNAIIFSANGHHALAQRNKIFYWNAIKNYFEPIYYDGDLNISKTYQRFAFNLQNLPNKDSFLLSIEEAKKKIQGIKIDFLTKQVKKKGSLLSEKKVEKKINQILLNLDQVKQHVNTKYTDQDKMPYDNSDILNEYAKYTLKWGFDIFLVFRDAQTQLFYSCKNNKKNCNEINLSNKQLKDLLRGRLTIENIPYQYIGEYSDIQNTLQSFNLGGINLDSYKKIKFLNTNFYYEEGITYEYNEKDSIFDIYQKSPGKRAYFLGGELKNILINFHGLPLKKNSKLTNYPFNQEGLTGCTSFIEMKLTNISITSINSDCEDSINLINTTGNIKKFISKNSVKDGLDIDFSKIEIESADIFESKNDCLDFSAGTYKINKLNLENCGDKGLSVGEKSYVKLNEITIENSNIGIASKDSSITKLENAFLKNLKICLTAYNKKQEFYGGLLKIKNIDCSNYIKKTDIDINSKIVIENEL